MKSTDIVEIIGTEMSEKLFNLSCFYTAQISFLLSQAAKSLSV